MKKELKTDRYFTFCNAIYYQIDNNCIQAFLDKMLCCIFYTMICCVPSIIIIIIVIKSREVSVIFLSDLKTGKQS